MKELIKNIFAYALVVGYIVLAVVLIFKGSDFGLAMLGFPFLLICVIGMMGERGGSHHGSDPNVELGCEPWGEDGE